VSTLTGIGKDALARIVAADIPPGSFVNLGIGLPTRISNHLPPERGVMLHTENGMLGMGPRQPTIRSTRTWSTQARCR
jgi:3-oxoadipate CoA-transferase beta subunit